MKSLLKLGILIFIMTGSFQGFAQNFQNFQNINYQFDPTTKKINNLSTIIRFNKSFTYDVDFKESTKSIDMNLKVSIELNVYGRGKMVMGFDNSEKIVAVIESAYMRTYNNSKDVYWEFQCLVENSFSKKYYLDFKDNSVSSFWFEADNNTRTYFLKVI